MLSTEKIFSCDSINDKMPSNFYKTPAVAASMLISLASSSLVVAASSWSSVSSEQFEAVFFPCTSQLSICKGN